MNESNAKLMAAVESLEIIIKITERCNINCTYCYMFNRGNDDYLAHPPSISSDTVDSIVSFIKNGISDLGVKHVTVVLHGGEPLMLRKSKFEALCTAIREAIEPVATLSIGIQTNAMLVDTDWIEIFEKHKISIGISLDGPAEYHDLERVDHHGRGTYAETLAGIQLLMDAAQAERITPPGAICVINPEHDAKHIYRHFVDELGFERLSFNLPMETHDSVAPGAEAKYTRYVDALLTEWLGDDNPAIKLRLFSQAMRYFSGAQKTVESIQNVHRSHLMIVIASNGDISEHDDFKVIGFGQFAGNVKTTSALSFANSRLRRFLSNLHHNLPVDCNPCGWKAYCRAGTSHGVTISRYSKANGFGQKSIYCKTFQTMFERIAIYLLRRGLDPARLEESLMFLKVAGDPDDENIDFREFLSSSRKVISLVPA